MNLASRSLASSAVLALLLTSAGATSAATLQVGPTRTIKTPCEAIAAAQDGDIIEVDAAVYAKDVCTVSKNGLTLRGVGGLAKLDVTGFTIPNKKAIWVIAGNDTKVENIEFTGAEVADHNGAGIRQEGVNLTVRGCYFHDNQEGILAGDNPTSEILIETSEFARNGYSDGKSHNMYINHVKKFTLQFSYSHDSIEGHLVKSRALENHILYNRITGEGGIGSYEIDIPDGGRTYIIGNLIHQGPNTHNSAIIAYKEETATNNPLFDLFVVNNTVINERPQGGTFVNVVGAATPPAVLRNNIFVGPGTVCTQANAVLDHNLTMSDPGLVNQASFDYHLLAGSPAVDTGVDPGMGSGQSLAPKYHYVHPMSFENRTSVGTIDIGAYELGGGSTSSSSSSGSTSTSSSSGSTSSSSSGGTTSSSGGTTSSSGSGGVGGSGGEGGSAGTGGSGGDGSGDEGGCGCRVAGEGQGRGPFAALALAGLLVARRRRAKG